MALLTATPALAAEQCVEVKVESHDGMAPTYAKYADTAHCFLFLTGDTKGHVSWNVAEAFQSRAE
jgi:hypothetical protein